MKRLAVILALLFAGTVQAQCPTNYVLVYNNPSYQRGFICVAKYEMKDVGGVATSQASGTPWVSITRAAALTACSVLGPQYRLMGNSDRMTIARDIEATASNWSTGTVNSGSINQGHSDSGPDSLLEASTDDNAACQGTGQTCSSTVWNAQRRTHNITGGGVIWDFSGNALEWVNWTITNTDKASPQSDWIEINASVPTTSMPKVWYWPLNETLTSTNLIGKYFPGPSGVGGYVGYGGGFNYGVTRTGIYMIIPNLTSATAGANIGFRCVVDLINLTAMHSRGEH